MAKKLERGLFITFDGGEGCGKSTHSRKIYEELVSRGYDVVYTAEPGGTLLGQKIRALLLEKEDILIDTHAELFLFEADRAQHVKDVIRPALREKKLVICDRFNTATFAYQGYALGINLAQLETIDAMATEGLAPDLTVLLDVDVDTGLSRAGQEGPADKMEKRGNEFHEKVRGGYLELAQRSPDRIKVIRVAQDKDRTYELVKKEVYGFIEQYTRSE